MARRECFNCRKRHTEGKRHVCSPAVLAAQYVMVALDRFPRSRGEATRAMLEAWLAGFTERDWVGKVGLLKERRKIVDYAKENRREALAVVR